MNSDDIKHRAIVSHIGIDDFFAEEDSENLYTTQSGYGATYLVYTYDETVRAFDEAIQKHIQECLNALPEGARTWFSDERYAEQLTRGKESRGKLLAIDNAERRVTVDGKEFFIFRTKYGGT